MDVYKILNEWKKGGYGRNVISNLGYKEYKASHDKMFIEGFRMAELYYKEEIAEIKKQYQDTLSLFLTEEIGRLSNLWWHDLEIDPNDLPEKAGWYWCKYETGKYGKEQYTGWDTDFRDVVAWCNLPEYEGVEGGGIETIENGKN